MPTTYQEIRTRKGGIIRLAHHPRIGTLPEYWGWNYAPDPQTPRAPIYYGGEPTRTAALRAAREAVKGAKA